jgi:AraC family transcriptional regulator of adaptative response/methylated-DNA-[protein]-cysteine methyltransferase
MSTLVAHKPKPDITATEQDPRWAAVVARDASADGKFWCAVATTGIYCRPSCPSRPLPRNVRFYDTIAEARAASFRPCKRCKPDEFRTVT